MARVIRGDGRAARVVPGEVVDARAEAQRIVGEARAAAEKIVAAARADAERARTAAHESGLANARAELAAALLAAGKARDAALAGAEREAQTLALAAAARIVGEIVALEPDRIAAVVRDALSRARRARGVDVRVHPDDVAMLEAAELGPAVRLVSDPGIARGGCVVKSELGVIDARVEVQLEAMARLLGCDPP
jgi:flagellar biosynthesis/type III secretory pathway protein FliH